MTADPDELPISDARDHFADILGRATYAGQITYITKRGRRVGAVVPVDVAEAAEAAEDEYLSGPARESEAELAGGGTTRPLSEILADLEADAPPVPQPEDTFGRRAADPLDEGAGAGRRGALGARAPRAGRRPRGCR